MKVNELFEDIDIWKREFEILNGTGWDFKKGEKCDARFFLDSAEATVWIPSSDKESRNELQALKIGDEFSYSNLDTGYGVTVKRIK